MTVKQFIHSRKLHYSCLLSHPLDCSHTQRNLTLHSLSLQLVSNQGAIAEWCLTGEMLHHHLMQLATIYFSLWKSIYFSLLTLSWQLSKKFLTFSWWDAPCTPAVALWISSLLFLAVPSGTPASHPKQTCPSTCSAPAWPRCSLHGYLLTPWTI